MIVEKEAFYPGTCDQNSSEMSQADIRLVEAIGKGNRLDHHDPAERVEIQQSTGLLEELDTMRSVVRERHETLSRQFAAYLANFRALLERQLGEIEGLQAHAQITHQVQTELLLKRHA